MTGHQVIDAYNVLNVYIYIPFVSIWETIQIQKIILTGNGNIFCTFIILHLLMLISFYKPLQHLINYTYRYHSTANSNEI